MKPVSLTINAELFDFAELSATQQQLVNLAKEAAANAYAPYSHFHVGAAVLLSNGETVVGNNQENAAYPSGLCAERVTMFMANARYPESAPVAIAVAAYNESGFLEQPISPCGACRQVLMETQQRYDTPLEVLLYGEQGTLRFQSVEQLLPFSFSRLQLDFGK